MEQAKSDSIGWLTALEALVFHNLVTWELTASYAAPVSQPVWFALCLLAGSTAAMLLCHVGPAVFAFRCAGRWPRIEWLAAGLLAAFYLEWLGSLLLSLIHFEPSPFGLALAAVAVGLAWRRDARRAGIFAGLAVAWVVLGWALSHKWRGIGTWNPRFSPGLDLQLDDQLLLGILVSATPVCGVAWHIGRAARSTTDIWRSGWLGVWLPCTLAITAASIATEAGAQLYWGPSLPRGTHWMLAMRFDTMLAPLATGTLAGAILLCTGVLNSLLTRPLPARPVRLAAIIAVAIAITAWLPKGSGTSLDFATQAHTILGVCLLIVSAAAFFIAVSQGRVVE